jgi:hypothetical protein
MPELTGVDGLTAKLHHALGWREGKRNATDQMSVVGTKWAYRDVCYLAAFEGKADISQRLSINRDL